MTATATAADEVPAWAAMRGVAAILAALLLLACGGASTPEVARTLNDQRVIGTFVSPYAYEHFVRGELARARGDLAEAAQEFQMARAGPEEDPLVLGTLAEVMDELGDADSSDRFLAEALREFPDSEAVHLARGRIAERRGDRATAITAYEDASDRAPDSETAPLALFELLREAGADGRADAVLESFIEESGGTVGALRAHIALAVARGDIDAAVTNIQRLLQLAPARASEIEAVARTALESGRPVLASRLLDATTGADERLRFDALIAAHRRSDAEALLMTLRDEDTGDVLERARMLIAVGRADDAAILADIEIENHPSPAAWFIGAEARLALGRPGEAAYFYARVPDDARDAPAARLGLARALSMTGLAGAAAEVLATLGNGSTGGEFDGARDALIALRTDRGDLAGARAAIGRGDDARARLRLARLLERSGDLDDALAAWRRVPPDDPILDDAARLRARAERLADHGDTAAAIAALHTLRRLAPDDLAAAARLAELLRSDGHADDARNLGETLAPLAVDQTTRARLEAAQR